MGSKNDYLFFSDYLFSLSYFKKAKQRTACNNLNNTGILARDLMQVQSFVSIASSPLQTQSHLNIHGHRTFTKILLKSNYQIDVSSTFQ